MAPEVRAHAEQIDDRSDHHQEQGTARPVGAAQALRQFKLEAADRAKLAKAAAAVWGAIGAAVMFALTSLVGGYFPKS